MNILYIPSLTHPSGQVLTTADWTAAHVDIVAVELASLLIRPGIEYLKQLKDLKAYWHWHGKMLLNLTSLTANKKGIFQVRSPFDGQILCFEKLTLLQLVETLKPDYITFSSDLMPTDEVLLQKKAHDLHENNAPSEDALNGIIYTSDEPFNLQDKAYTNDFSVLDATCACPACKEKLTRAYFQHLYQHTPLLCHRWLIMHNQWLTHHEKKH
ncbi:MAG: hypothetical protein P1U32_01540 [Legionellaceae bacterium]|nr:hypothetical protein [Legionellaceae bacterium]